MPTMNDKPTEPQAPGNGPNEPAAPESLTLEIEKIVTGGAGLARHDGMTIFVPLTAPGDRITAHVTGRKKKFAQAALDEVLEPGPDRREPPCPVYGQCGGCDLQHLEDAAQRRIKTEIVADCFHRLGKLDVSGLIEAPREDLPTLGMRNRIRLYRSPVGFYGLMRRGSHDVVPLDDCPLMPEAFGRDILPWARLLPPVDEIVIRMDGRGGWLAALYGQKPRLKVLKKILGSLPAGEAPAPGCVGMLFNNLPVWGRDYLVYEVASHKYRVGAQAFFQSNLTVTEDAVATVRSWLDELKDAGSLGPLLGDLFCGVGLFTLALADQFEKVVAIDIDGHAMRDLQNNVERDETARGKVKTRTGKLGIALRDPELASPGEWAESCCLVDPPRVGLGKDGVPSLLHARPRHVVYMSCDPATLARDCAALAAEGYEVRKVRVMDMFPQTAHIETLVLLERRIPAD